MNNIFYFILFCKNNPYHEIEIKISFNEMKGLRAL